MPFPLGGDFARSVVRDFKVISSDPSRGAADGFFYASPSFSSLYKIANLDSGSAGDYITAILSAVVSGTYTSLLRDIETVGQGLLAQLLNSVSGAAITANVASSVSSFWPMVQFFPGQLPHAEDIFSDLYVYDVFSIYKFLNRKTFHFLSYDFPKIKQEGNPSIYGNLVQTDYYTTISGSVDPCVGDEEPPVITLFEPTASGIQVRPRNQTVDFLISDAVGGVDISSLFVSINSTTSGTFTIVSNGADQTGGDVSIIGDASAYQVTYTPSFLWDYNDTVTVTISGADLLPQVGGNPFFCEDNEPNHLVANIPFQVLNLDDLGATLTVVGDVEAPYISSSSPASGTLGNNVFDPFILRLADDLTGVNLSKTTVSVNGIPIIVDGVSQSSETTIAGTSSEYLFTYTPDIAFTYGSTATVEIYSEDQVENASPNVLDTSYTFSFIEDSTLIIENFIPAVGTHHNVDNLNIQVDIRDDTYGVDTNQTFFVINGTIVSGTQTPLASGVQLSYHPPNDFAFDEPIRVTVHGTNDNSLAPVVKEAFFNLFYGCRLYYDPKDDFPHLDSVDVFVRARNVETFYKDLSTGYFFTTYTQPNEDIGASIVAINPQANLAASIVGEGPEHRYGQTVTVEFSIEDFNGNLLGPFIYTYTIENNPD